MNLNQSINLTDISSMHTHIHMCPSESLDKLSYAGSRSGSLVSTTMGMSYTSPVLSSDWRPSFSSTAIKLFGKNFFLFFLFFTY